MYLCMYVRTCVRRYARTCVSAYVCTYVRMYACMCACMHACLHACMYVCICVYVYVCMCVCVYACMCVCMYVCLYFKNLTQINQVILLQLKILQQGNKKVSQQINTERYNLSTFQFLIIFFSLSAIVPNYIIRLELYQ